jgi:endoglucanase
MKKINKLKYLGLLLFLSISIQSFAQDISKYIVVDQFGYRTLDKKVAVIRDPQTGFDANESFTPSTSYELVNADSKIAVFTAQLTTWNNGQTDSTSGDKAWWFDFSSVSSPGNYYVFDPTNNVKSYTFEIADNIYDDVLKHAVRTFFYQRVGFAKEVPFAEAGWADGASHIAALQDKNCRLYNDKTNVSKEKDVSGGWYDAGDLNKYTIWTANYVYEMLQSYEENPMAWTDDYNLPESGNTIPDLIDEAKWGMDHLLRLQNADGSVIAVVDEDHASPPSSAKGQSLYGGVNTGATWATASTFAYGSKVFRKLGLTAYADQLQAAAIKSYDWAEANPAVIWKNNDNASGTSGLGSGQQEIDDYGRLSYRLRTCAHLFENTNDTKYKTYFEANYSQIHLIPWYFAFPFETREQEILLYYSSLTNATASVKTTIKSRYTNAMVNNDFNIKAFDLKKDPYRARISDYVWGSNGTKSNVGNMFFDAVLYNTNATRNADLKAAAQDYIHYLHGVNPLNICYLSNMYGKGAENCVNEFYHTWFADKSTKWDRVGTSTYGPAPGFLVGGPNPSYKVDGCCPSGCGSAANNMLCSSTLVDPLKNQPAQKSYLDFNSNWPLNSWEVTENSCGYQMAYIRLLSKFVDRSAIINATETKTEKNALTIYPNPAKENVQIVLPKDFVATKINLLSPTGTLIKTQEFDPNFSLKNIQKGVYIIEIEGVNSKLSEKIVVE